MLRLGLFQGSKEVLGLAVEQEVVAVQQPGHETAAGCETVRRNKETRHERYSPRRLGEIQNDLGRSKNVGIVSNCQHGSDADEKGSAYRLTGSL